MRPSPLADLALARTRINFSWFLRLRWAAVLGQVVTIAVVALWLDVEEPWVSFAAFVGFEIVVNVALSAWFVRSSGPAAWPPWASHAETILGGLMVLDIVLLSGLLFVSGGSANPFAIFFLVNLTLGAIVLRATWAWVLSVFTLVCFTALFQFHQDLAGLSSVRLASVWKVFSGATSEPFEVYLSGKLVAVATVSSILVYFITRLATVDDRCRGARPRESEHDHQRGLSSGGRGVDSKRNRPLPKYSRSDGNWRRKEHG